MKEEKMIFWRYVGKREMGGRRYVVLLDTTYLEWNFPTEKRAPAGLT